MNRGDVWWARAGHKRRPVLVLTRPEVVDVRDLVAAAEISTTARGLAVEVPLAESVPGLVDGSVANCDGVHTIRRSSLTDRCGELGDPTMRAVSRAVTYALGC